RPRLRRGQRNDGQREDDRAAKRQDRDGQLLPALLFLRLSRLFRVLCLDLRRLDLWSLLLRRLVRGRCLLLFGALPIALVRRLRHASRAPSPRSFCSTRRGTIVRAATRGSTIRRNPFSYSAVLAS